MEDIDRIQGEQPFLCASVKHVVNESKQGRCINFSKNKKRKNGSNTQEKQVAPIDQETPNREHETEQKEHRKTYARENHCGNIFDIEA